MADGKIVVKAEVDAKNAQKELDSLTKKSTRWRKS